MSGPLPLSAPHPHLNTRERPDDRDLTPGQQKPDNEQRHSKRMKDANQEGLRSPRSQPCRPNRRVYLIPYQVMYLSVRQKRYGDHCA
jgi:hypothetical protein